jgi:hypothetical protein
MTVPPLILDLRGTRADGRPFRVWLPLFLLWPVALVLGGLAVVAAAVVDAVAFASGRQVRATRLVLGVLGMLAAARGTEFDIDNDKTAVHLTVR